jgi:hypothetical protein
MKSDFAICGVVDWRLGSYHGHAGHDHPGPLLGAILGHCAIYTHPKVQPVALHCSLATWCVLYALTAHKPAHGHGHYHAHGGPDFLFATEVTQGSLSSLHYTHIKRTPKSRCAICNGCEDTAKMSPRSRGTCLGDLAGDRQY